MDLLGTKASALYHPIMAVIPVGAVRYHIFLIIDIVENWFLIPSHYLGIRNDKYVGYRSRKGEWENVPDKDKYMHEYLPEPGNIELIFTDALDEFGRKTVGF